MTTESNPLLVLWTAKEKVKMTAEHYLNEEWCRTIWDTINIYTVSGLNLFYYNEFVSACRQQITNYSYMSNKQIWYMNR